MSVKSLTEVIKFEYQEGTADRSAYSSFSDGISRTTTADQFVETLKLLIKENSSPGYTALLVYNESFVIDLEFLDGSKIVSCPDDRNRNQSRLWLFCGKRGIRLNRTYMKFKYYKTPVNFKEIQLECTFDLKVDEAARSALDKYISIGEMIRTSGSKEFSNINDLIVNFDQSKFIISEFKPSKVEDPKKMFIAVIAPRMTGKTQLAFSVIEKKPLYFVVEMDEQGRPLPTFSQVIYRNFKSISDKLIGYAEADVKKLPGCKWLNFSKSEQIQSHSADTKFESLGFLYALMLDSTTKYIDTSIPWMKFYSERSSIGGRDKLQFTAKSIKECRKDPLFVQFTRQFFVFLDEVSPNSFTIVFLRNMCCVLEFTCVITSLKAEVIEAGVTVESDNDSRSRDDSLARPKDTTVACAAVTKLSFKNVGFETDFNEVKRKLEDSSAIATDSSEAAKMQMLLEFFESQLKVSRPGIAENLLKFMKEAADLSSSNSTFDVLEHVLSRLTASLGEFSHETFSATSSLFFKNCFMSKFANGWTSFLYNHSYYLNNPVGESGGNVYLLWPHRKSPHSGSDAKLDYSALTWNGRERETNWFRGIFDSNEILLVLSYFLTKTNTSISYIFEWSKDKLEYENRNNRSSYSFASWLRGWDFGTGLENVTIASCIHSSHQSLKGLDGSSFMGQLVKNYNKAFRPEDTCKLTFPGDDKIEEIMKTFHVPFLYVAGVPCPAPLEAIAQCGTFIRRFRQYDKYDALVDVKRSDQLGKAIFECKDLVKPLIANQLIRIVNNAADEPDLKIHFTVCKSLGRHLVKYESDYNLVCLGELAEKNKYNIYKIKQVEIPISVNSMSYVRGTIINFTYQLVSYCSEFKHFEDPKLVFIIIDLNEINKTK